MERRLKALKVSLVRDRATELEITSGAVTGVRGERGTYPAGAVVLATGGVSYPATGSTGEGHRMAREAGHTVTDLQGSLVPLRDYGLGRELQGLSLRNVGLAVFEDRKKIYTDFGEMLFTHFGVSGPLVLSASAHMRHFGKKTYRLEIDLKPALDEQALDKRLLRDFEKYANHDFCNALDDLLPQKLIPVAVERSGIPPHQKVHDLTREQRRELVQSLKHFSVEIAGPCPVTDAIVTSGGIKISEIDPKTMESKLVKGLYFAGEMHGCGRLYRRIQPADRLGHRPGGGTGCGGGAETRGRERMSENIRVAIDGPSGAGKSTLARSVAARLNFLYVDTGAIYRTIGYAVWRKGIDPQGPLRRGGGAAGPGDLPDLWDGRPAAHGAEWNGCDGGDPPAGGVPATPLLVSAYPEVRAYLLEMQRQLARENSVVMDGRDIGTVVLPDAEVKVFLTASAEERARRRMLELEERGTPEPYAAILRAIQERDWNDTHRDAAPLRQAEDAVLLDTTALDFVQSEDALLHIIRERTGL